MPRSISEISNAEIVALATSPAAPLDQLSDEQLLGLSVSQGYLNHEQASAALQARKQAERAPVLERLTQIPASPAEKLDPELEQSRLAAQSGIGLALSKGGRVGDVAAQVLSPIAGAIAGTAAGGLAGTIAGGGTGGAAGDALVQARQFFRGERDELSKGELATATLAGGIPLPAAQAGKPLAMAARRAAQGAAIATGADAVGQFVDTGTVNLARLAETGALGLLFGGAAGAGESLVLRRQVLKAVRETPEFRGFQGSDSELVDAVRAKLKPEPRNVTPGGKEPPAAASGAALPPPEPTQPPAAVKPNAQAEFESRAGLASTAAPATPPISDLSDAELLNLAHSAGATGMEPQLSPGSVLRVAPGDTAAAAAAAPLVERGAAIAPAVGPADLRGLSDAELVALAQQQADSARNESTAPATSETSPAPTAEAVSGSTSGQAPSSGAASSDGGQAPAEMPAPTVQVKPKGPRLGVGAAPDGSLDLLSLVEAEGGVRPPTAVRNAGGEYDGFADAFSAGPARLLRNKNGPAIDVVLQALEANHGLRFDSPDAFYSAVAAAAKSRDQVRRAITKQIYEGKVSAALLGNAGRKPALNPAQPVLSDALKFGESLHIRGELYTVDGIDPDTGAVTLKGGTILQIPPGTPIYPDRGAVFPAPAVNLGANPFEPRAPYDRGLAAGNRYAELTQKLTAGKINALEQLELEAFEAGAGQRYVPGSMDPAAIQADRARAAAASLDAARQQVQARAEQRLIAPDLATQQDFLGPNIGDTGSLFEPGAQIELPYDFELSPARGTPRLPARPPQPAGESGRLPADRGTPGRPANITVDPAEYLRDPIANAGSLAAALQSQQRISSIVADYFAGALPSWSPVGKLIRNAADVAALMAPLRNPYAESFKVVILDPQHRVTHAEVIHIGVLASTNASLAAILRVTSKTNGTRIILSHNHPSGDPTPSTADWRMHEQLQESLRHHGITVVDDVVTNGHAAYSITNNALVELDHASPAPWERLMRRQLVRINPNVAARLAAELRQSNPDSAFVLFLTQRNALTAIEQIPASALRFANHEGDEAALRSLIEAGAAREGAAAVIIAARHFWPAMADRLRQKLSQIAPLVDVITDEHGSLAQTYWLGRKTDLLAAASSEKPGAVHEPAADYADFEPSSPVLARGPGAGKASPYAKVNLAHLANIKIVQMPELVRLTRELTGQLPELRKLRSSLGHFDPNNVTVRLDPRIFRDQLSAAKTLAHEIGHLVDYLDDGTLKRGNLLGRLRSLRDFLKNSFGPQSVTNKDLRAELRAVTQWWKPYDPASSPEWFVKYRESAVELYADAISVLFNSPAELKARAPQFWTEFFAHLDSKPETKQSLLDLWDFLNKPHLQTLERRSEEIRKMFVQGDEIWLRKAAEREARYANFRGWSDRFRQEIFDIFDPLVRKAKKLEGAGRKIPREINPRLVFDEHPLAADNQNYRMLQRLHEQVVKPVEGEQFTLHELGEYLFLQRVLNERFVPEISTIGRTELANPLGMTPETARLGLLRMRLQAGFPRMQRLEAAAAKFHDIVFERIAAAVDAGVYSRKIFSEVLAPNKSYYATFAVLDHLQDTVPAGLRMQQGTFKEIANPFTATVLKTITLNRLIQLNTAKQAAAHFLEQFDPAAIASAPRSFDGKSWRVKRPTDPDKELLELLQDGKPAGYHVDPAVAEMFERVTPAHASAIIQVLQWPFRKLIYPLIIKYNPAFQLIRNPLRDARRSFINVPRGLGLRNAGEAIVNIGTFLGLPKTEAIEAVRAYIAGQPHPLIAEMIARQAIGTPYDNFAVDLFRGDKWEQILRDFALLPEEQQRSWLRTAAKPLLALGERLEFAGLTFEMLPKVSTYKILTRDLGWHAQEAAHFVRNNVGTPNLWRKGKHVVVADQVVPFLKIFLNGLRADVALAKSPKTAGGWWLRWALSDGLPTILQAAAALGLLGAGIKELYDGISEYNKANYNVVPIGTIAGGQYGKRVMYLRFPRDDMHRLMSGLLYESLVAMGGQASKPGAASVLEFGTDQLPGLNPVLKIASAWHEFLEGQNPMDGYRGRPVLSHAEWLAGGWPAYKGMLGFTLQNAGVSNWIRFDPNSASTAEMTLSAVPGLNTFLQTTDTGYRERQEQIQQGEARQRAELRVAMPPNVQNLLGEYYYLRGVKSEVRTVEQVERLVMLQSWHKRVYQPYEEAAAAEMNFGSRPDRSSFKNLEEASRAFERGR